MASGEYPGPFLYVRPVRQTITQALVLIYEEHFSKNSFSFRPKRGAQDALK